VGILSGDHRGAVEVVADALDLPTERRFSGLSPEQKLERIQAARREQRTVVMVGDGVNDAAALAAATVGVAVHGGAEACLAAADVYIDRPGLAHVARLVRGARQTLRVIRRNLAFSLAYNMVGAGLALAGLISPLVAAVLMPLSSLTVLVSSYRVRTFDDKEEGARWR
jgi:Cu2+-exporting ATPase